MITVLCNNSIPKASKDGLEHLTASQITKYLNATDSSQDIESVRFKDYELAFRTDASSKKYAILKGYVGSSDSVHLPENIVTEKLVDENYPLTTTVTIPVLGMENGMFGKNNGYYQPIYVYVPRGAYNYFGAAEGAGFVDKDSARRTTYLYDSTNGRTDYEDMLAISNGMILVKNGADYVCVDSGNASSTGIVEGTVTLNRLSTAVEEEFEVMMAGNASSFELPENTCLKFGETETPIQVALNPSTGKFKLTLDASAPGAGDLASGLYTFSGNAVYNLQLKGGETVSIKQPVTVKVNVAFNENRPQVATQSKITLNTYYGTHTREKLNITNSYGTAVTNVSVAENTAGISVVKDEESFFLCWDGVSALAANTPITLEYTVEGFAETVTQNITVSGSKTQPAATASAASVKLVSYPYGEAQGKLAFKNLYDTGKIDVTKTKESTVVTPPKGGSASDLTFDVNEEGEYTVAFSANVVSGAYKVNIAPYVKIDEDYFAVKPMAVTFTLSGKKPAVKFEKAASVTANSVYFNTPVALPKLIYADRNVQARGLVVGEGDVLPDIRVTVKSQPKNAVADGVEVLTNFENGVPEAGIEIADGVFKKVIPLEDLTLSVKAVENATVGNYILDIAVPVYVEGSAEIVWLNTTATVKVVHTLPVYKFTKTSLALEASKPFISEDEFYSYAETQLMMNAGDTLVGFAEKGTSVSLLECTGEPDCGANGSLKLIIRNPGIKAGSYIVKKAPIIKTANNEQFELAPVSISVKVMDASTETLTNKASKLTLSKNQRTATLATPFVATKPYEGGDSFTYEVKCANDAAYSATGAVTVDSEGYLTATGFTTPGTYVYSIVRTTLKDGKIIGCSKAFQFTVVVNANKLDLTPSTKSVQVFADYSYS
ncbi:MAG: hypothetical protein HUJ70_02090, partial [Pseudobutyrivibrio sp.]|nr:hypothetical protein [Pseudobutyrivibrio sp.]